MKNTKKLLAGLLALCLLTGLPAPRNTQAATGPSEGVAVDSTNFPDANFRKYVNDNIDTNKDGKLSPAEIAGTKKINVSMNPYRGINSLKGLEHFTKLETLDCSSNNLITLDLSNNKFIQNLTCRHNPQLTELRLHSDSYELLRLTEYTFGGYNNYYDGYYAHSNITEAGGIFKVTDITKPAVLSSRSSSYTDIKIIYVDKATGDSLSSQTNLFSDYGYKNIVSGSIVIYGNGGTNTVDGKKVNSRTATVYTDITASYIFADKGGGKIQASVGKVIAGVTKSGEKPTVTKNRITDTSATKIAKASVRNGQVTVTAAGKEGGTVYLWVIDTGQKGTWARVPVAVRLIPTKLEVQNASGSKLQNAALKTGETTEVNVAGFVGTTKTEDGTYTVEVNSNSTGYVTAAASDDSGKRFTITGTGTKNGKNTKASMTFKCDQNGKKVKFSVTVTPPSSTPTGQSIAFDG